MSPAFFQTGDSELIQDNEAVRELLGMEPTDLLADASLFTRTVIRRIRSEFLAMMSHEIRTPMNGIMEFAALLKASPLTEEQQSFVRTIESIAESLLLLPIGDILDLAKIEVNQMKVHPVFFDLPECVQEICSLLRSRRWKRVFTSTTKFRRTLRSSFARIG